MNKLPYAEDVFEGEAAFPRFGLEALAASTSCVHARPPALRQSSMHLRGCGGSERGNRGTKSTMHLRRRYEEGLFPAHLLLS